MLPIVNSDGSKQFLPMSAKLSQSAETTDDVQT